MGSTKKALTAVGAAVVLTASCLVAGIAASFQEAPPTIGVYRVTAYTLRGGEWQIGAGMGFRLLPISYSTGSVSVAYGITSWLLAEIGVSHSVQAGPPPVYRLSYDFSAKVRLSLGMGLDLGLPIGIWFYEEGYGILAGGLRSGAVLSLKMGVGLTVHGGVAVGTVRGVGWYFRPYAIADLDLLPNLKLVGEFGLIPVSVAVGAWLRLLPFLDVKLSLIPIPLSLSPGLYLRF